jgi:hypothetical protein
MKSTQTASTGPRSAEGKARSSMNALKSGIYSKSLTIPGEDPARLDALHDEYVQRFCPDVPEQRDLVDILVRSTWTLRRLATAEAQVWTYSMDARSELDPTSPLGHAFNFCDKTLTRLQRMVNSTQRNFRDALRELERIQSLNPAPDPPAPEITLVPTPPPKPPTPTPGSPQPAEPEPVTQPLEFVSSTSAQRLAPSGAPLKKPLPYHKPGSDCCFLPNDRKSHPRCPRCYPPDDAISGQE